MIIGECGSSSGGSTTMLAKMSSISVSLPLCSLSLPVRSSYPYYHGSPSSIGSCLCLEYSGQSRRRLRRSSGVKPREVSRWRYGAALSKKGSRYGTGWKTVSALLKGTDYEFREEGGELEVRVPLPPVEDGEMQFTARYVAVDTQPTSLVVGVQTARGVQFLLNAESLYGRIQPNETVWFVDETEIVVSLKKADREQLWPDLVVTWESLAQGVASQLKGASVYIVGESTEVNWAVAEDLAAGLGYVPLKTQQLIEQLANTTVSQISLEDGEDAVTGAEEAVLNSLSQHVRCVVATLGGISGAAAHKTGWNSLYSGFSIWLSQSQALDEASAKEEVVRAKQEGHQAYSNADVVVALSGWDDSAIRPTAEGSLRALKYLLDAEKDLPGKKSLYVRLGCRGDWPEIMPPGWDPSNPQDETMQAQSMTL